MKKTLLLITIAFISLWSNAQVGYINTIAGTGVAGHSGDGGAATSATLGITFGIAFDHSGNIIFADNGNNAIRKIYVPNGLIRKVAGTYYTYNGTNWYYGGDGGLATSAYLAYPFGVALDTADNIYVADNLNNVIRKITVSTGIITTVAGDGTFFPSIWPFCGDGGPATSAQLNSPWDVAVDRAGNLYIADMGNNVVRKVDAVTGIITTVAGNGTAGYTGNGGQATSASLNGPNGITVDATGNLYITDDYNSVIRKVTKSTGIITTIAGNGTSGFSGDNGLATAAQLNDPSLKIAFDANGDFYIADDGNSRIRKITVSSGIITTIAGNGSLGYTGDNGPATAATLNGPEGVGVDALGNIYITDENNVIRKINGPGGSVPAAPGPITGNTSLCGGTVNTYSITPVTGATSYTWLLPGGWYGTSITNSISAICGNSGTISVTANNLFGSSTSQTLNVGVTNINVSVTQNGASLHSNVGSSSYQWVDCNGYLPLAGQTSNNFTATSSGTYAVIISQGGCTDTSLCHPVFIAGPPPTPAFIYGNTTVCNRTTNLYFINPVNGATSYTWTLPGGWTGTSISDSIYTTVVSAGTISVTANNASGSSAPQTTNVSVITVDTSVTQVGATLTANASVQYYRWFNCNGYTPLAGQNYQSFTATSPGSYAVSVNKNGCIDTSSCYTTSSGCGILITGADLPYDGLSVMLAEDTVTNVSLLTPGTGRVWNYSNLLFQYPKFAVYKSTAITAYASVFPSSNINTYGPGSLYGSLFGGAPVGAGNGYCFWRSDSTGFWVNGFRPETGIAAGINVHNTPEELVIGAPATYGSVFTAYGRWELPLNRNSADVDTFYIRTIKKQIVADACGALTTPYATYPNVLREHEYITEIDSVYGKFSNVQVYATEYKRDSTNTYSYIAKGIGYPVCVVHCDKHNVVQDVEYFDGYYTGIDELHKSESQLLLYPNPADNNITIEMPKGSESEKNRIYIYDAVGSIVLQKNTADKSINIDISTLSKGIYFVKVNNKDSVLISKFMVQ